MNQSERLKLDGAVDPILFYAPEDPWGCFSNFSRHPVTLPHPYSGGLVNYQTSEHRYQAMKAMDANEHDWVAESRTAGTSKSRGNQVDLRPDWGDWQGSVCWFVMVEVIFAKVIQNDEVSEALLGGLRRRHIYEDSPVDDIWGWRWGQVCDGKNLLGKALMHVRDILTA